MARQNFLGNNFPRLLVYEIFFYQLKKALLISVALGLLCIQANAQEGKIDSLENVIKSGQGLEKFEPLVELAIVHANTDYNKAIETVDRAFEVASNGGDTTKIVRTQRMKGQLLNRLDRSREAIEILSKSLVVAKRHNLRNEIKTILNNLALAYTIQAEYEKALKINFETLLLREADGDKAEISISLNNIGYVYFKLKNYTTSLDFFHRSLLMKQEANEKTGIDKLYINIGLCHNQLGNFKEAEESFSEGFRICGDNCHDQIILEGEFGLGVSNYFLNSFQIAKYHFGKSLAISKKLGLKRFVAENLMYFAHIYVKESDLDSALVALQKCEEIAQEGGYNELLISSYKEYANVYTQRQQYQLASHYQDKYITLKDSIISGDVIDKLAKIQTDYAERENIKTIANKDEIIERQRSFTILIVIIAVLAALLVFVLYRSNAIKKKVNSALSEAKAIIEDQNRQLLNSNIHLNEELKEKNIDLEKANESLRRVNDELDNFIYKTSHDIRGPLASLKGMCNVALMDVHDPVALSYLRKLDITAEKLNTILTRLLIVNQINNSVLGAERIDFVSIVNDVLLLEKKKGLPPRLAIRKQIEPEIEFYSDREFVRIIFENLIDNAIKFYNDSQRVDPFVDISVRLEKNHIRITVIDNGIGISQVNPDKIFQMFSRASERSETGGIGLYITKTAVQKLGGIINLKTTPEGDTEFYILLPLATSKVLA